MKEPKFQPGFRFSAVDGVVIVVGAVVSAVLWANVWWYGFVPAFVVGHFFLFCNIFRLARLLELLWGGIFVVLTCSTLLLDVPSWPISIGTSLLVTVAVVTIETRKPSYHGVFWHRINPRLPQWWEAKVNAHSSKPPELNTEP